MNSIPTYIPSSSFSPPYCSIHTSISTDEKGHLWWIDEVCRRMIRIVPDLPPANNTATATLNSHAIWKYSRSEQNKRIVSQRNAFLRFYPHSLCILNGACCDLFAMMFCAPTSSLVVTTLDSLFFQNRQAGLNQPNGEKKSDTTYDRADVAFRPHQGIPTDEL